MSLDERLRNLRIHDLHPDVVERLERVRARGRSRRNFRRAGAAVTAVAAAVVIAVVFIAVISGRHDSIILTQDDELVTYRDPERGWTLQYPKGWHVQRNYEDGFEYQARAVLVSNWKHQFRHPDLGPSSFTSAWDLDGFPVDAIIVEFGWYGGILPSQTEPDTPLPLSLERATQQGLPPEIRYGGPDPFVLRVIHEAYPLWRLTVWLGAGLGEDQIEIARRIVSSVTFGDQN
jgi:hypothetical protein